MDHYATLGIPPGASPDEVRQAYLTLAKKYHPDKNKSPEATTVMAEINLAYETLCDSQKRKQYDLEKSVVMENVPENDKEQEVEQEPSQVFGKCVKCNFVNSSGVFVCSVCGYTFDPEPKSREQNDDVIEELDDDQETTEENLSEIIRCPQCNEINMYSRGTCWHCGLHFEIGEIA